MSPASTSSSASGAGRGRKEGWPSRCRSDISWIFTARWYGDRAPLGPACGLTGLELDARRLHGRGELRHLFLDEACEGGLAHRRGADAQLAHLLLEFGAGEDVVHR